MRFHFSLQPSAKRVIAQTEKVAVNVRKRFDGAMSALADQCVFSVKKRIESQWFAQLKDGYLVRKRAAGLDPRILIATQAYYDGIEKVRRGIANYGVKADMDVARWNEDGYVNRPPRPHWAPAVREAERLAPAIIKRMVVHDLP